MNIVESLRRRVTPAHRHPAHDAAALLAQLSDAHYGGIYDEDAAVVAAALRTIRRHVEIPGQLGELFMIAAEIAERADEILRIDDDGQVVDSPTYADLMAALREIAAEPGWRPGQPA